MDPEPVPDAGVLPVTIIPDRHGGMYSGAAWLAFPLDPSKVPDGPFSGDVVAAAGRDQVGGTPVGRGGSPNQAYHDLIRRLAAVQPVPAHEPASEPSAGPLAAGPVLLENNGALVLLGMLEGHDPAVRRRVLEVILCRTAHSLDDEACLDGPGRIIAAAAVVAAGLPPGEAIAGQIAAAGYDPAAVTVPEDAALADDALAALLVVTGRDSRAPSNGAWDCAWPDPETALRARAAADELTAVLRSYQHRYDQELPLEF